SNKQTPHPASLRSATFSRKGRRDAVALARTANSVDLPRATGANIGGLRLRLIRPTNFQQIDACKRSRAGEATRAGDARSGPSPLAGEGRPRSGRGEGYK